MALVAAVLAAAVLASARAEAQSPCYPVSVCTVTPANAHSAVAAGWAQFDLAARFLDFMTGQGGTTWQGTPNAGGGGADMPVDAAIASPPVYRAWAEGYGQWAHTGAQTEFAGDTRRSVGGVAGLGMMVGPGAMIGLSVDQSRTRIDVTDLPQHATVNLTQIGINGVYETGPWTLSAAGVYGLARIGSDRDTTFGPATAAYSGRLFGVIAEVSYYRGLGTARIVPKFGLDWTRTETDAYTETAFDPVSVPALVSQRARAYLGAEVGNTWILGPRMFDLSAYGKVVDVYWRDIPVFLLTQPGFSPETVQGVMEGRLGFDTGAMASYRFARNARVYAGYDGRFRDGYRSHGGTVGLEVRW